MSEWFRDEIISLIPKLRSYAKSLTGSAAEADDLVQDALVRAWRFRESFREGAYLKAWVFRIMRNEFLAQRAARRPAMQQSFAVEDETASEGDQNWRVRWREVMRAMGRLPDGYREALLLVVAAGLTCEEAADVLGCAAGTVKSRVSRARGLLHDAVDVDLQPDFRGAAAAPRARVA